jgi:DtxR family transcriptional regulator, Mn-dependent transcriptional regulator
VVLICTLAAVLLVWPNSPVLRRWRASREARSRRLLEDALKHLLSRKHSGRPASSESLAGALQAAPRKIVGLVTRMDGAGLITCHAGGLHLTEAGERWALQVVRAHRLWETYLAHEARMPVSRLHAAAERAEHSLTPEEVDALDAHLGFPKHDPHGDPIPSASGEYRVLRGVPLTDWPAGHPAEVIHIEDEPASTFEQITATGLRLGSVVKVLSGRGEGLRLLHGDRSYTLPSLIAANVLVAAASRAAELAPGCVPLSRLEQGEEAQIAVLGPELRGFSRRRLLDFGMTPGTRVMCHLKNPFGDPTAFRVRGTTVALRRDQAEHVWVKQSPREGTDAGSQEVRSLL